MFTINVWEVEEGNGVDFSLLHFPAIWLGLLQRFLKRPAIALLLHRISHVAHCVYVLTKALLVFIPLLKIAYVELKVEEVEACTCVTYIAKSNNGSMEITNQTSWSKLCTYVEGGWWEEILLLWISLLYLDNMRTWLYYYFYYLWTFMCPFFFIWPSWVFLLLFFDSPCLIWRILEREIIKHGVLLCGWMEWHSWLLV